jgi:hypothetical protein
MAQRILRFDSLTPAETRPAKLGGLWQNRANRPAYFEQSLGNALCGPACRVLCRGPGKDRPLPD